MTKGTLDITEAPFAAATWFETSNVVPSHGSTRASSTTSPVTCIDQPTATYYRALAGATAASSALPLDELVNRSPLYPKPAVAQRPRRHGDLSFELVRIAGPAR